MAWRKWSLDNINRVKDTPGIYLIRTTMFHLVEGDQYYGMSFSVGLRKRLIDHWNAKSDSHDYLGPMPKEFDVEYCDEWTKAEIQAREAFLIGKYQPWQNIQHHPKGRPKW